MVKRQKTITKRFSVPENDPATLEWCELQGRQLSIALRIMIHRQIRESGLKNMFATDDLMLEAEQGTSFTKSQTKQTQAKTSKNASLPDDKKQESSKPADTSNSTANATDNTANATNNDVQNDNGSEDDLLKKMMMD